MGTTTVSPLLPLDLGLSLQGLQFVLPVTWLCMVVLTTYLSGGLSQQQPFGVVFLIFSPKTLCVSYQKGARRKLNTLKFENKTYLFCIVLRTVKGVNGDFERQAMMTFGREHHGLHSIVHPIHFFQEQNHDPCCPLRNPLRFDSFCIHACLLRQHQHCHCGS